MAIPSLEISSSLPGNEAAKGKFYQSLQITMTIFQISTSPHLTSSHYHLMGCCREKCLLKDWCRNIIFHIKKGKEAEWSGSQLRTSRWSCRLWCFGKWLRRYICIRGCGPTSNLWFRYPTPSKLFLIYRSEYFWNRSCLNIIQVNLNYSRK